MYLARRGSVIVMPPDHKPTILVVDDVVMIADTVAEILSRFGYHALKAYDAESALEIALKTRPTLLLTDVMLPRMNGVDLAIKILEQQPDCKIVLFSGQAGTTYFIDEAKANGYHFDILSKPLHPRELLEHLEKRLADASR